MSTSHLGESTPIIERMLRQVQEDPDSAQKFRQMCELASIGSLVGGITHTLNNIMGGILGYSQLMKQDLPPTSDLRRQAEIIEKATKRASTLISQVQFYTKGQGRDRRIVNPQALIDDVVAILSSATTREIVLSSASQLFDAKIEVEPASVCHALLNICMNAIEAMPDGGELTISTNSTDQANGTDAISAQLVIEISDSGSGIAPENIGDICKPFYSTKPANRASGVGLSIAREIIAEHGGRLEIVSTEGKGTTVSVYLPLAQRATTLTSESVPDSDDESGTGDAIMVVDDEYDLRLLAKRLLERRGHKVFLAGSGSDAIKVYEENAGQIGVVILDMIMPGVDGKEVYKRMKNIQASPRFILTSGYPGTQAFEKIIDCPRDQFIAKPWDLPHLIGEAEKVLGNSLCPEPDLT